MFHTPGMLVLHPEPSRDTFVLHIGETLITSQFVASPGDAQRLRDAWNACEGYDEIQPRELATLRAKISEQARGYIRMLDDARAETSRQIEHVAALQKELQEVRADRFTYYERALNAERRLEQPEK